MPDSKKENFDFGDFHFLIVGKFNPNNSTFTFELKINPSLKDDEYADFVTVLQNEIQKERSLKDTEEFISALLIHDSEYMQSIGKVLHVAVDNAWIEHFLATSVSEEKRKRKK